MGQTSIDRRTFVGALGALGALSISGAAIGMQPNAAVAAESDFPVPKKGRPIEARIDSKTGEVAVNEDVVIRYAGCVGCYSACGNRVKLDRETGSVLGVGGNPYNPASAWPPLAFEDPLDDAYRSMSYAPGAGNLTRGTVCGRGNATLDAVSQPDRITVPLKRAGKRGEGKWKPISWDQLIAEVTEGGKLFADIGEDVEIEGFKAVHDTKTPMNPYQPDLGPKSNQIVIWNSRADGRRQLNTRFAETFGTLNAFSHSSSCAAAAGTSSLYRKADNSVNPDVDEAEYILWSSTFPGGNGSNFQAITKRAIKGLTEGTLKIDILDPTLSNGAVTPTMPGITWIPIKPATNGALYAAVTRLILESKTYNEECLSYTTQEAAEEGGYAAYTNASYLVIVDEGHPNNGRLMRAADAGIEVPEEKTADGKDVEHYVVIDAETNEPAAHDSCACGVLQFEGEVNGVRVRTAFSLLEEQVAERTIEEYADITGVPVAEIERIAEEYVSHGVKASVNAQDGSTATVNGYDTPNGREILQALIGSNQMSGGTYPNGLAPATVGKGVRYDLVSVEGKPDVSSKNAVIISRGSKAWEATDEYANRIAAGEKDPKPKLPWFANAAQSDNQALMSVVNQYPYQCKIMMTWMCNVIQATPGAMRDEVIERLKDTSVVPLHIVCDIVMGEMAQYADYFVPDVTQYESFGLPSISFPNTGYGTTVRWPAKTPGSMALEDGRYACWETLLVDVAKACDLPGWGEGAIPDADGALHPLNCGADFYLKAVANLAYAVEPVDDITDEEVRLQALDKLPDEFRNAVADEEYPKVLKVLSRGCRYWPADYTRGDDGRCKLRKHYETYFYNEKRAANKNCYSGKRLSGTFRYNPQTFADLTEMSELYSAEEYPFSVSEHKARFRSVSMLSNSPIMRDLCSHNYLEINDEDAAALGIEDGDVVRAVTPAGDVTEGEAMVRAGQVKGAFSISFGYGHLNYGAQDVEIDGELVEGNPAIGAGVRTNMMLDPVVSDDGVLGFLSDPEASSPGRCGGMFKIEKA